MGIKIVTGHRFLGGFIGDSNSAMEFVSEKVQQRVSSVRNLSEIAILQ